MSSILVYLDVTRAFDKINHRLLVAQWNFHGFHDWFLKIVKTYLKNRKVWLKLNSDSLPIKSDVSQRSVLGALLSLFILQISTRRLIFR